MDNGTKNVFVLLQALGMPGLRYCEDDPNIEAILTDKGFQNPPDLICGPDDLRNVPIEGFFFIDVNEPSGDCLFKEMASKQFGVNIPQAFRNLLGNGDKFEWGINQLPTVHYENYLKVLNNKLDKYSHLRFATCNTGIVHFFDLGNSRPEYYENQDKFFTMLDYLHFYTRLEWKSGLKDLIEAEKYFLKELTVEKPRTPYIVLVHTAWENVPVLFLMLHVITYRGGSRCDAGIMMLNKEIIIDHEGQYPIHNWILQLLLKSARVSTDTPIDGTINIYIQKDKLPFM